MLFLPFLMAGIVGYGAYVPRYRIKAGEIATIWGKAPETICKGLNIKEKSVPGMDEDSVTISVEASRNAIRHAGITAEDIGAVFIGSESPPYAVKPSSTIVAEAIGASGNLMAADFEFACKAGTQAILSCLGLVDSGMVKYGLGIGADTSQGRPGDALEYTASAGGAAFILGKNDTIADIENFYSYATDTPDFWRREGQDYPRHGARFTGKPAYFKHVIASANGIMEKGGYKASDFDYVIFHQPNGKFPLVAAKKLGIQKEKVLPGLLTPLIGNTYSGATPLGLAAVLDNAKPGDLILATSFGSGAGSDSMAIRVNDRIEKKRANITPVENYVKQKEYLSYGQYVKHRGKLKR